MTKEKTCKTCKAPIIYGSGQQNFVNLGHGEIYCSKCWNAYVNQLEAENRNYRGWPTIAEYQD